MTSPLCVLFELKGLKQRLLQSIPNFGEFLETKKDLIAKIKMENGIVDHPKPIERHSKPAVIPKIKDIIGTSLKYIGPYKNLDNKKQVVALINDVRALLRSIFRTSKI